MQGKIVRMRAADCVMDWDLWPRREAGKLDSSNIIKLRDAVKTGIELPPIIIDAKSKRIIDGFHRHRMYTRTFGDGVEIDVEVREYASEAEMFLDAMRYNTVHGLGLSTEDKTKCLVKALTFGLSLEDTAKALGLTDDRAEILKNRGLAVTSDDTVVTIPNGAKGAVRRVGDEQDRVGTAKSIPDVVKKAVPVLTNEQIDYTRAANGMPPSYSMTLLVKYLRAKFPVNSTETPLLIQLVKEIEKHLARIEKDKRKVA
jgi:hypothetical protein